MHKGAIQETKVTNHVLITEINISRNSLAHDVSVEGIENTFMSQL